MEANDEAGSGPGRKMIWVVLLMLTVILLVAAGIVIWVAFSNSDVPAVKVQRLSITKFYIDGEPTANEGVLSADLELYLESTNKNSMTTSKLDSMVMVVNSKEYGVGQLGESSVDTIEHSSGVSKVMVVRTHGESHIRDNKQLLTKEHLKLDVTLSGNVIFSLGPCKSDGYAFMITCTAVSATSKDSPCTTKLYTASKKKSVSTTTPNQPAAGPTALFSSPVKSGPSVYLTVSDNTVTLDNGIVAVTIAKPYGHVTGIKYNGVQNILDEINPDDDRGYWDMVWVPAGAEGPKNEKGIFDRLKCTIFRVIVDSEDGVEVSFSRPYDPAANKKKELPMNVDLRYILLRGESGVYSYGIFKREKWPGCAIANARLAFKLMRTKFRYLAVNDIRQRKMPLPEDRMKDRGEKLAYPEAVVLTNPIDPEFKGEVDDKYQYSDESHDIKVHGYYSNDPPMGFWQITPSYEFRIGGPSKQFLTSHVGPSVLAMFVSAHYSGETVIPNFEDGEPWTKVFGPVFMYLNKIDNGQNASLLWEDAKKKMLEESNAWPYSFPASDDFLTANQRANVTGRLLVLDRFVDSNSKPANGSYVGLSKPGEPGSWQIECKGYQFWTTTDDEGRFIIDNVRPGSYNLYGWVPGFIGDFRHNTTINLTIGRSIELGDIIFEPPRDGPTLWEIGVPDRTAKEFFVPDPDPKYVNKLYVNHPEKFRQYGLWERYAELYPNEDLIYTVDQSDYQKDWFFAQVTRKVNNEYNGSTWQIKFNLESVDQGAYKMRLAIAGTSNANLEVRVNELSPIDPIFIAGDMGRDNSIARHGIHGMYWFFSIDIQDSKFKQGENTIYLSQTKSSSPFQGIMYDYIRLEAPTSVAPK